MQVEGVHAPSGAFVEYSVFFSGLGNLTIWSAGS